MYCVGLTGNLASGKSTVASFFKTQGVIVISADEIARKLTAPGQPALTKIKNHFGKSVFNTSGQLDRAVLRDIVFAEPKQRLWLEKLLHPLIRKGISSEIMRLNDPYCIIEIPLLTNRRNYPYLNRVLLVLAEQEQQIERVMCRDKSSRQQALMILATQSDGLSRQKIADDIIVNDGSFAELAKKIGNLHNQYLQFANQKR